MPLGLTSPLVLPSMGLLLGVPLPLHVLASLCCPLLLLILLWQLLTMVWQCSSSPSLALALALDLRVAVSLALCLVSSSIRLLQGCSQLLTLGPQQIHLVERGVQFEAHSLQLALRLLLSMLLLLVAVLAIPGGLPQPLA